MDTACYGINLKPQFKATLMTRQINIQWLKYFYEHSSKKQEEFFDKNFNYHAGNDVLR